MNVTSMEQCARIFEFLSLHFEKLNEFSRDLRNSGFFHEVRTGTDLRSYQSGWALEKYVEGTLNRESGETAVWWIDISFRNGRWRIHANLSISYGTFDEDVETQYADSLKDFEQHVQYVTTLLLKSFNTDHAFRKEIDRLRET